MQTNHEPMLAKQQIKVGPRLSLATLVFTLVNPMLGSCTLAIPYGMHQAGFGLGTLLVLATSACMGITALQIVKLCNKIGASSYPELTRYYLRDGGCFVVYITNLLAFAGCACSNFVFLLDSISAISLVITGLVVRPIVGVLIVALLMLICILAVDLGDILKVNAVAAFAGIYILIFQLFSYGEKVLAHGMPMKLQGYHGLCFGVLPGMVVYSELIHCWLPSTLQEVRDRSQAPLGVAIAFILGPLLLLIAGQGALLAFGEQPLEQNLLMHFDMQQPVPLSAAIALTLQSSTITLLMLFMSTDTVKEMAYGLTHAVPDAVHFGLNTSIIMLASFVALVYPQVADVMAWCGAFTGLVLGFVLPAVFWLSDRDTTKSIIACLFQCSLLVAGFAIAAVQIVAAYT